MDAALLRRFVGNASELTPILKKGGEGSGDFNHAGRPGEVGGSTLMSFYHGTVDKYVDSIKKEGLVVKKSNRNFPVGPQGFYEGARGESVFVTTQEEKAKQYSAMMSGKTNGARDAVVLHFKIPSELAMEFKTDDQSPSSYYTKEIPAKYLVDYLSYTWKGGFNKATFHSVKEDGVDLYAVVGCID